MKVNKIDFYFDGGTAKIETDIGEYFLDRRLKTETENCLYLGYPGENNSVKVDDCGVYTKVIKAVKEFLKNNPSYHYNEGVSKVIEDLSHH